MIANTHSGELFFKWFAQDAVADEEEFYAGLGSDNFWCHGKKLFVPLQVEEPGNFTDDNIIGFETVLGTDGRIVCGGQVWVKVEAGEDACVLFGLADPGPEVLIPHGVGHDDEVMGAASSEAFCIFEKQVSPRALEAAKGGSVDAVDDERYFGHCGC